MISLFLDSFAGQLSLLLHHAEAGDLAGLRAASHDLQQYGSSVGANLLTSYCAELEGIARAGRVDAIESTVASIVAEFKAVRPELEALLTTSA